MFVFLLGNLSCGHSPGGRPDVVLITLDTTRWDHLSCYGQSSAHTPNLDSIAGGGILFTRALTTVPVTLPAHASILTGLYPPGHGVHNNGMYRLGEDIPTMASVLSGAGYRTGAVIGAFVLDSQFGLDTGFDVYDDHLSDTGEGKLFFAYLERDADAVTDAAISFIENSGSSPLFLWVHYFDPHYPYDPPSPYDVKTPGSPYAGEVMYVDDCVGRLVGSFEDLRGARPAVTVIVGDHGEDLGDHGEMSHGVFVYESTMRVPLIISSPDLLPAGKKCEEVVSVVDVFPTLLDLLGVEREDLNFHGVSLLEAVKGIERPARSLYLETRTPYENMGWSPLEGVISGDWKYIDAPAEELYNTSADPGEKQNLAGTDEILTASMRETLDSLRAELSEAGASAGYEANSETLEKLASLGYITGFDRENGTLADPKDMLPVLADQQKGLRLYDAGDYIGAEAAFGEALENDPTNVTLINYRALCLYNVGKPDEALVLWKRALRISPGYLDIYINIGSAHLEAGEPDSALTVYDAVLSVNPRQVKAKIGKGKAYRQRGEPGPAGEALISALDGNPDNNEARFWLGVVLKESGNHRSALKEFDIALALNPGMQDAKREKALTLVEMGREEDAVDILEELIGLSPSEPDLHLDLGFALEKKGDLNGALENYREAAELDPASHMAYNNIGTMLDTKGWTSEAEEAFRRAISIEPDFSEAYYNLGFLLLKLDRTEEAHKVLNTFLSLWKREDAARERVKKTLENHGVS